MGSAPEISEVALADEELSRVADILPAYYRIQIAEEHLKIEHTKANNIYSDKREKIHPAYVEYLHLWRNRQCPRKQRRRLIEILGAVQNEGWITYDCYRFLYQPTDPIERSESCDCGTYHLTHPVRHQSDSRPVKDTYILPATCIEPNTFHPLLHEDLLHNTVREKQICLGDTLEGNSTSVHANSGMPNSRSVQRQNQPSKPTSVRATPPQPHHCHFDNDPSVHSRLSTDPCQDEPEDAESADCEYNTDETLPLVCHHCGSHGKDDNRSETAKLADFHARSTRPKTNFLVNGEGTKKSTRSSKGVAQHARSPQGYELREFRASSSSEFLPPADIAETRHHLFYARAKQTGYYHPNQYQFPLQPRLQCSPSGSSSAPASPQVAEYDRRPDTWSSLPARSISSPEHKKRVFITYAKDGHGRALEHLTNIKQLMNYLASEFIVNIDFAEKRKYAEDRMAWIEYRFTNADQIIAVISPEYSRVVGDNTNPSGSISPKEAFTDQGLNTRYIYRLMQTEYLQNGCKNRRFMPVVFPGATRDHVPRWLNNTLVYTWPLHAKDLRDHIAGDWHDDTCDFGFEY